MNSEGKRGEKGCLYALLILPTYPAIAGGWGGEEKALSIQVPSFPSLSCLATAGKERGKKAFKDRGMAQESKMRKYAFSLVSLHSLVS